MNSISSELWVMLGAIGTFLGGVAAILTVLARQGWLRWLGIALGFVFAAGGTLLLTALATIHFGLGLQKLLQIIGIENDRTSANVVLGACLLLSALLANAVVAAGWRVRQRTATGRWAFALTAFYWGVGIWVLSWSQGDLLGLWVATLLAPPIAFAGGALTAHSAQQPRQSAPQT